MRNRNFMPIAALAALCSCLNALPGMAAAAPDAATAALRYEIWVTLDPGQKMLHGREEIRWTNTSRDSVPDMRLHLYANAFRNEASTLMQEAAAETLFSRVEAKPGRWGWIDVTAIGLADGRDLKPSAEFVTADEPRHPGDRTVMRIRFPEPVAPGQSVSLKVEFEEKVPGLGMRTGVYGDSFFIAQWFPKPGVYEEGKGWSCHEYHLNSEFFADFADFSVHISTPSRFVVGASGKLAGSVRDAEGRALTHTYVQARIHDFAWTASPDFIRVEKDFIADREVTAREYAEAAGGLGLAPEDVRLPNVKMILLISRAHASQIERHFKALRAAIKYYGLWYGPYPYETVTMVDPPFRTGSGGMEYPTLFTAGTSLLTNGRTLSPEGVIVHEFGHGYWYGLVANNEFEEAWLDEGINTYSTGRVLAEAYGRGEPALSLLGFPLGWFLKLPMSYDFESDRAVAINTVEFDPVITKSWEFYGGASYGANVYMRASTCLNTLERLLGRGTMARIMRTFQSRFRFKHPKSRDFFEVASEVAGRDMSWFFEEFFTKTLDFDYGISSIRSAPKPAGFRGILDVRGIKKEINKAGASTPGKTGEGTTYLTTVTFRRFGEARVGPGESLKIKVVFKDGSEESRSWDGQGRWTRLTFETKAEVDYAVIDPAMIWLMDSNLANNSLRAKPVMGGILRLAAKALFILQNLLLSAGSIG
jgi:hypothetical protein